MKDIWDMTEEEKRELHEWYDLLNKQFKKHFTGDKHGLDRKDTNPLQERKERK